MNAIMRKSRPSPGDLKAIILVGGLGTRLRPLTDICPKPMVPVLNRPFLEYSLAHLKQYGIEDVILAMSYLPDSIREYFGNGERCGVKLTYCLEKEPLGTAGAVKNAAAYLDRPFIVLNGDDVFIEMDLQEAYNFHHTSRAMATIFLTWVENPDAFGVVETDINQQVRRFIEKPPHDTASSQWINAGGYILEPAILKHIPPGQFYMFEKGLFPHLLNIGAPIYGYEYRGYWLDTGTPEKYFSLNADFLFSRVRNPLISGTMQGGINMGEDTDIHASAVIIPPVVIGRGCRIGKNVNIKGPVVIGNGCIMEAGCSLERAILWDNTRVKANTNINRCIISGNITIEKGRPTEGQVITPSRTAPLAIP
jgi:mannose-1-phosphate guanylyltransferase